MTLGSAGSTSAYAAGAITVSTSGNGLHEYSQATACVGDHGCLEVTCYYLNPQWVDAQAYNLTVPSRQWVHQDKYVRRVAAVYAAGQWVMVSCAEVAVGTGELGS